MKEIANQVLYAFRGLRRTPGFTVAALAIFALGIGANTAIFGIVNAVLLKPLPFPNSSSVVAIFHVPPPAAFPGMKIFSVSAGNYFEWRKQNNVFESMSLVGFKGFRMGGGSRPQSVLAAAVEPGFFGVLGVQPAVGRAISIEECQPGRDDVIVLSHVFAENHFGTPALAVGRTLELNGRAYRVIGVMPKKILVKSWFPGSVDGWVPVAWTPELRATRGNHNFLTVARLREGVTLEQAQAEMNVISERLARTYPEEDKGWGAVVIRLRDHLVGDVRPALLTLLGAVGFVLLIACANTANLVLARTITRRKELAIRAALGASSSQVIQPVLWETTLLSLGGGALGLLLARSGQALVMGALADRMPNATEVHLDYRVLAFTLIVSVVTGLASGLIASWRLMKVDVNESLKIGFGKSDVYSGGKGTRAALVVSEVALSLVLLVGAGLMVRTLWALRDVNPGFDPSNVMTMTVPMPPGGGDEHRNKFYDEFLPRVRLMPGVVSAGAIDTLPLSDGGSQQPVVIEGRPAEVFALQPNVGVRSASPGYLKTMRIPLLAGRDLEPVDTEVKAPRNAVLISEAMARQFWPGENPIGQRLRISFTPEILREVVGVVGDVKERGLDTLDPLSIMYVPLQQDAKDSVSLVVRTAGDSARIVPAVTRILHEINPELPVRDAETMESLVAASLSRHRFSMFLFVALASLAFLLAAVGIYSVLAYSVRSRVHEITVRIALGAQVRDVLTLVISEGMKPALIGIAAGTCGALLLSGVLSHLIFGVSPTDPYTYLVVAGLLASVALMACLIPAYRATRVEPVDALRNE